MSIRTRVAIYISDSTGSRARELELYAPVVTDSQAVMSANSHSGCHRKVRDSRHAMSSHHVRAMPTRKCERCAGRCDGERLSAVHAVVAVHPRQDLGLIGPALLEDGAQAAVHQARDERLCVFPSAVPLLEAATVLYNTRWGVASAYTETQADCADIPLLSTGSHLVFPAALKRSL